ncbi:MAG: winged helix-turn-helix domain-containing protein [Eubacteriales bacterium]|nr:winged helix-turn-helix transcriptional regulator [Clostridiales bacterium]
MKAEISHAPGRFAALLARMLVLELERAGVSVTETGGNTPAAEVYIYVDEEGSTELSRLMPADAAAPRQPVCLYRYPFKVADFIQAVLYGAAERESKIAGKAETEPPREGEPLVLADGSGRRVIIDGIEIPLTEREYRLFFYLYERRGRTVSRLELLENVWDGEVGFETNVVEVYISYLRNKLEGATGKRLILTRRGKGYEFRSGENHNTNKNKPD